VGALLLSDGPAAVCWLLWIASQAIVMIELLRPRSSLFGPNFWRGRRQPRVALTFDDGPHPDDTPAILDILKTSDTRATFFFVGSRARRHPDLVLRAAREGHEIGAHSDTHPWWFSLAGPARLRREVRDAVETLERITQKRPRYFRPPMGHKNFFLAEEMTACGLRMTTWSARPYDTMGGSPTRIRKAVAARARPGGIVLLHEGVPREPGQPSATVSALAGIIEELNARGLVAVSLGDLEQGSPPESPQDRAASGPATGAGRP
jgi:peptidoglycan/xylan/chitin deacetylase (PgdA/CDA1 family)